MSKTKKKRNTSIKPLTPVAKKNCKDETFKEEDRILMFLNRVAQWLEGPLNYGRVINIFTKFDSDGDNLLSSDDFSVAMRMMEVPATRAEIDALLNIIDPQGSGKVNILQFDKVISDHRRKLQQQARAEGYDEESKFADLTFSPSRVSKMCPHCNIGLAGPPHERHPKYIKLKLILALFKDFKSHPGHFEQVLVESTTIHGLKCLIQDHLDKAVASVAIFKDMSCSKESFLDPNWCLGYCGVEGGSKSDPVLAEVFYDYFPEMNGCPILMDDSHMHDVLDVQARAISRIQ